MTIWILAVVWLGIAVSSAYVQGAIRAAFALLGIVIGLFLAIPLSSLVVPVLPFVGITSSWTQALVAPVVAFFGVGVVFKVVGAFVHRKIEFLFKYRLTDAERTLWERMNHRVGGALGVVGGCIYFMATCLLVTFVGYATIQVGAAQSDKTILKVFSKLGEDVVATHMDKVVGGYIDASKDSLKNYYDTCDFVGFLVQNRDVFKRMTNYPPFYAVSAQHYLEGDPARQNKSQPASAIFDSSQYMQLLATENDPSVILDHELTQMILTNTELKSWLQALDLKDLQEYLTTGHSPKFAEEKILGKWSFDWPASFALTHKENPDMTASETILYNREVPERYANAVLTAALDKVVTIRIPQRQEGSRLPTMTNAPPRTSYTGTWRRTGGGYALDLRTRGGEKVNTTEAVVRRETVQRPGRPDSPADRLSFKIENKTVCFDRIPE